MKYVNFPVQFPCLDEFAHEDDFDKVLKGMRLTHRNLTMEDSRIRASGIYAYRQDQSIFYSDCIDYVVTTLVARDIARSKKKRLQGEAKSFVDAAKLEVWIAHESGYELRSDIAY